MQGFGTLVEILKRFGGRDGYRAAVRSLLDALYRDPPGMS